MIITKISRFTRPPNQTISAVQFTTHFISPRYVHGGLYDHDIRESQVGLAGRQPISNSETKFSMSKWKILIVIERNKNGVTVG